MKYLFTDSFPPFSSFLPFHSHSHLPASIKSHHPGTEHHPPCATSPEEVAGVTRIVQLSCPKNSSKVAYELVKLCDTQQKCSKQAGTALSEGPIKILRNLASGCGFKSSVMPQTSTKLGLILRSHTLSCFWKSSF